MKKTKWNSGKMEEWNDGSKEGMLKI